MADVVFVAIALAFFSLCVLYVRWCDVIIGPDEVGGARADDQATTPNEPEELAA